MSGDPGPGLILAINGADERLQLALGRLAANRADAPTLLAAQEWAAPGQAARYLAPSIRNMLGALGFCPRDLHGVACVTGPGSFTGLRMSLALAEGLAAGTGTRLAGLNHLALLAREAAEVVALSGGAALALAWSRRGQVYAQAFQGHAALAAPAVLALDEIPAVLAALPRPLCLLGGGLRRNQAFIEPLCQADAGLVALPRAWDCPRPETLLTLSAEAAFGPGPLEPVYLRASDAEDNLAAIAAGRGLDEDEARAILDRGSRTLS